MARKEFSHAKMKVRWGKWFRSIFQWIIIFAMVSGIAYATMDFVGKFNTTPPNMTTPELEDMQKIWSQVLFIYYFAIFSVGIFLLWGLRNIK